MIVTDTHCHLYFEAYAEDLEAVIARAADRGVERCIVVGTDVATSRAAFDLARAHPDRLWATAGLHPHDASTFDDEVRAALTDLCERVDCRAVGETGLDHFKEFSPRDRQLEAFGWHLELARRLDKPVIVHCRDAHEAVVSALRAVPGVRGVMHCYTMGVEELDPYLELGFSISFSGVVTYPANARNRAAAARVPIDLLLVETDSPFLSPHGRRGKRNEPAAARDVLEAVARERNTDVAELAAATTRNAARLFRLPEPA